MDHCFTYGWIYRWIHPDETRKKGIIDRLTGQKEREKRKLKHPRVSNEYLAEPID